VRGGAGLKGEAGGLATAEQDAERREARAEGEARVAHELAVQRFVQPDDTSCGPTCLRKVYDFYGLSVDGEAITAALERNEDGGTLAVFLGIAALKQGFRARIYSYDLRIFDPTWAELPAETLTERIFRRFPALADPKRLQAAGAYIRFLEMGGEICFDELTHRLLKRIIDRGHPVLAGLSATYLYRMARERWDAAEGELVADDVRGEPIGHFVVITGYDKWGRLLTVLDPHRDAPVPENGRIVVEADRLTNAILLGDMTYDAVLLEVWPAEGAS
jgi:hypothetical protein